MNDAVYHLAKEVITATLHSLRELHPLTWKAMGIRAGSRAWAEGQVFAAITHAEAALGADSLYVKQLRGIYLGDSDVGISRACLLKIDAALVHVLSGLDAARNIVQASKQLRNVDSSPVLPKPFVSEDRISEIRSIKTAGLDTTRLVRLLEEINYAWQSQSVMATAMLLRAAIDHIPPIFGFEYFKQVAAQHRCATSVRKSIQNLEQSLRNIVDAHLHVPIRRTEILPTTQQVNFSQDFDVLLAETIRVIKDAPRQDRH